MRRPIFRIGNHGQSRGKDGRTARPDHSDAQRIQAQRGDSQNNDHDRDGAPNNPAYPEAVKRRPVLGEEIFIRRGRARQFCKMMDTFLTQSKNSQIYMVAKKLKIKMYILN